LASLPERRRIDLALKVAGFSYEEIRARTPGRTRTNVNKSLVKARARIRRTPSRSG
jgi:DNA-directed RNA polymerase specialized sigma24 family protein